MTTRSAHLSYERAKLVYGYIRVDSPDETQIAALRKTIGEYCREHDYRLVTICCDRGSDGSEIARPGFTAALDALALPTSHALLVPTLEHLSPDRIIRQGLHRQIKRTGAKLLTLTDSRDVSW